MSAAAIEWSKQLLAAADEDLARLAPELDEAEARLLAEEPQLAGTGE